MSDIDSLKEDERIKLRAEVAEWRQVAKVEAKLRREFREEADRLRADLAQLRKGIQDYLDGNYEGFPRRKVDSCPHGRFQWETCDQCIDAHFRVVLSRTAEQNREGEGG